MLVGVASIIALEQKLEKGEDISGDVPQSVRCVDNERRLYVPRTCDAQW